MKLRSAILGVVAATLLAGTAAAQGLGGGSPLTIIVPFNPGGAVDTAVRNLAHVMSQNMGETILIDNRPGGASTIGMNAVARAAPDGLTLGAANISFAVNPAVLDDIPYDTETDFEAVGLIAVIPLALSVNPNVPARSVEEFIELARNENLTIASAGYSTSSHLSIELFMYETGITLNHVPYRGGESQLAAVSGDVDSLFSTITTSLGAFESGDLIPLAVSTIERDPRLPDVPTVDESGIEGFDMGDWIGLVAPAGTPREAIDRINAEIQKALASEELQQRYADAGAMVRGGSPEDMAAHIEREIVKWADVVETMGIVVE